MEHGTHIPGMSNGGGGQSKAERARQKDGEGGQSYGPQRRGEALNQELLVLVPPLSIMRRGLGTVTFPLSPGLLIGNMKGLGSVI